MITRLTTLHFPKVKHHFMHLGVITLFAFSYCAACSPMILFHCAIVSESLGAFSTKKKDIYSVLGAWTADDTHLDIKPSYLETSRVSYYIFQFAQIFLNFMLIFKLIHSPSAKYFLCKELIPFFETNPLINVPNKIGLSIGLCRTAILWLNHQ